MGENEQTLSKQEIDEYIRLNYRPDDGVASDKGLLEILKGARKNFRDEENLLAPMLPVIPCSICWIKFEVKWS